MDIVKNTKINWLGMKWYFIGLSTILGIVSVVSILGLRGLNLGVDFTGGTLVYIKFKEAPDIGAIRSVFASSDLGVEEVTRFDELSANEIQVKMARIEDEVEEDLGVRSKKVFDLLADAFPSENSDRGLDLNNISRSALASWIETNDPEGTRNSRSISEHSEYASQLAEKIIDYRIEESGMIRDFSQLDQIDIPPQVASAINTQFYLGEFTILSVESVGPKVGRELTERAQGAVLFSLLGMLVYIAFRFRPIYGIAAIIALFHDVFLTLGLFSITGKEISLTVIAALLTLVGYSINDTIVIFDRVRENLKNMRRENMFAIINASINQTLNRTIMTSGMTFLAVFALYLFGGEALNGFSFALVAGIIVGTYSSVAIASPIVLWWENFNQKRKARA
jgi:preprotein translocase subunit SecF